MTLYKLPPREQFVIRPVHDLGFKALMGHKSDLDCTLLRYFLKAVIGKEFDRIEFRDREITADQILSKNIRLDLRVYSGNVYYNIEMQMIPSGSEAERIMYYVAMSITDQKLEGKGYSKMEGVHQIFLLAENSTKFKEPSYYFEMRDKEKDTLLTDKVKTTMINVQKIVEKIADESAMSDLEKWCLFLNAGHDLSDERIKRLMEEERFRKAVEIMRLVNEDETLVNGAFQRMKDRLDEITRLENAKEEAKAEGMAEGIAKGRAEAYSASQTSIALNLMSLGLDNDAISKAVELSIEKVMELRKQFESTVMMVAENSEEYHASNKE